MILAAAGVAAQTLGSAEELRAAVKKELAPLELSIKEQAKSVAAGLAQDVLAELADAMQMRAPRPQLARRSGNVADRDAS